MPFTNEGSQHEFYFNCGICTDEDINSLKPAEEQFTFNSMTFRLSALCTILHPLCVTLAIQGSLFSVL